LIGTDPPLSWADAAQSLINLGAVAHLLGFAFAVSLVQTTCPMETVTQKSAHICR
jgi:hypothetical protein